MRISIKVGQVFLFHMKNFICFFIRKHLEIYHTSFFLPKKIVSCNPYPNYSIPPPINAPKFLNFFVLGFSPGISLCQTRDSVIKIRYLGYTRNNFGNKRKQHICIHDINSNIKNYSVWCSARLYFRPPSIFVMLINDITKCSNKFKYILYADDSTLSTCVPGDNVVHSAELINNELICLNRWLKSNKISIDANKTKDMLFSYN